MKYKSKYYAKALSDLMFEKRSPADLKKLVNNFLRIVEKNRDIRKLKEILFLVENSYYNSLGGKRIIVQTARKTLKNNLIKIFKGKNNIIDEKINPKLIAGIKIVVNGEQQIDFSLAKKLEEIFSNYR